MSNLGVWYKVPNGSRIEMSVDPTTEDCSARARIVRTDETEALAEHDSLVPGPYIEPVADDNSYSIRFSVVFQSAQMAQATIIVQVRDATGAVIPDSNGDASYVYNVEGKAGDAPARATAFIVNKNA
jgi:hypothetical protein